MRNEKRDVNIRQMNKNKKMDLLDCVFFGISPLIADWPLIAD